MMSYAQNKACTDAAYGRQCFRYLLLLLSLLSPVLSRARHVDEPWLLVTAGRHLWTVLQANNKYQEVFTSSIDELDRRILMQGVSYE